MAAEEKQDFRPFGDAAARVGKQQERLQKVQTELLMRACEEFDAVHLDQLRADPANDNVVSLTVSALCNVSAFALNGKRSMLMAFLPKDATGPDGTMRSDAARVCELLRKAGLKVETEWQQEPVPSSDSPTGAAMADMYFVATITW